MSTDPKPLKPLADHNRERAAFYEEPQYPRPNGIACPKCGHEMQDDDGLSRMSNPPCTSVSCPSCGHQTYRNV